jgi:hypothetical protein
METQVIEKFVALLLYPNELLSRQPIDCSRFMSLKNELWTMNLGQLESRCKIALKNESLLLLEIKTIRKKRNQFVHDFFMKYADQFMISEATDTQLKEMIGELDKLHEILSTFAHRLELLVKREQPKYDAINSALLEFGKARRWEPPAFPPPSPS